MKNPINTWSLKSFQSLRIKSACIGKKSFNDAKDEMWGAF
jgi:hypothetical protein